jgi:replicative DNA helicase
MVVAARRLGRVGLPFTPPDAFGMKRGSQDQRREGGVNSDPRSGGSGLQASALGVPRADPSDASDTPETLFSAGSGNNVLQPPVPDLCSGTSMSAVQTIAVPPHNIEAEKSVLGAVLLDERHLHSLLIEEHLRPEHFYREQHGAVFAAMLALYESDRKIDHLTVAETLRQHGQLEEVGGAQAIDELAGWVPAAGHAREYGRIVRDNAQMRALLTASYEIQASVLSREAPARELVEQAERSMLEVAHDDRQKKVRTIADILHEETDKLHRLSVLKTPLTGTPSGFKDLDEKTGGFQPGNLVIVAARPSMGKSALVANVAENAVLAGHAVALFSLEMSESELAQRFVASQARIKGEDLRRGRVAEHRWPKILEACQRLSDAPLFIDDSSDTGVLEVRAKARRLHHQVEGGLGLIIIDYLQLMRAEGRIESRVEQVSQISRGLKGLARELNVPVIALSQLSRAVEQRGGDKKPVLSDLRESGAIEQDADLVMFIYREEYYDRESERPGEADIIIAKHRNGPVGEVVLTFQKEYPKFMNYAGERFAA